MPSESMLDQYGTRTGSSFLLSYYSTQKMLERNANDDNIINSKILKRKKIRIDVSISVSKISKTTKSPLPMSVEASMSASGHHRL